MLNKNLAYEASAGSGKTFMLVVRYLSLLFLGASPTKILALTFTNKAASEMQERIIQTLQELETRGELEEILKVTELSRIEILSKRKTILDDFLNSNVKIMTIDKFFAQILRKFSLYASLMPDFNTMSSQHELKLLSRFLKEVSVSGKRDSLITLSLESNKRVTDIFTLLDNFYSRFQELSHLKFQKQEYLHFEGLALDALDDLKHLIDNCSGASPTLKKAVEVDSFNALKEKSWVAKESLNYWVFKKCFTPEMDIHLRIIQENLKNHARAKEQNFFYALSDLVSIYIKAKQALFREDSELSFNDVTALVYYILKERIDSEFLYFRLDAQIVHILLDEFQDTSILQYSILKPLIDEILSGSGVSEDGSFFFVGDVKQSIYRFRGGVSALFHEVATDCDTDVEQLLVNYRSLKEVVEFVNRTFEPTIKNYTPQKVKEENESGFVEILQSEEILDETLTQVKRLIESGATLDDIAILCATNGDGESIKHHLEDDGLEVVTETTTKLINQTAVKALIEHLKYLYFSKDIYKHNFFALINQEPKDIMKQDLNGKNILTLSKSIIQEYKLAVDDSHLIRFLDVVSSYEDIEAFLFEYERQDASGASSELSGVRVLTIHKSKGLEYKHIIVMDRLKKAPPLRDAIIYEYDGIRLQNLYLRTKGRDGVDEEYATALQKEKTLAGEDSLNALYVAFTRARDNLIIVMKPKASSFEVLNLQVGSFGELKIQDDEDSPQEQPLALQKFEYKELYYGTQSDILRAESKADEDLKAINFGLALHYMLEMLDDFNKQSINNAKNMMINKYGYLLEPQEIQDITARVLMLVEDEKFISLSSKHYYKEKPLRYKKNLRYIDLLIKKDDGGYNIIDYKSSTAYKNHHNKQVINYVKAVKEITQKQVDGYICYLLDDKVKIVKV